MTTLDDKILGEKLQYYYSSSEDEGSDNEDEDGEKKTIRDANVGEPEIDYSADGSAVNTGTNTHTHTHTHREMSCPNMSRNYNNSKTVYSLSGPKGVINDWRKYKQLEVEQKQEQKKEMERLIKKLSMTCRSDLDLEKDKEKQKALQDKIKGKVRRMRTNCRRGTEINALENCVCHSFLGDSLLKLCQRDAPCGKRLNTGLILIKYNLTSIVDSPRLQTLISDTI